MWKYFTEHNTKKWLHILDKVTFNYNNSVNRNIKMKPADVTKENKDEVWVTLYGDFHHTSKPRYSVGDFVCVEKHHSGTRFVKSYTVNFTDELFKITRVYRGDAVMYESQSAKSQHQKMLKTQPAHC